MMERKGKIPSSFKKPRKPEEFQEFYRKLKEFQEDMRQCTEDVVNLIKIGVKDPDNFNYRKLVVCVLYLASELKWLLELLATIAPEKVK